MYAVKTLHIDRCPRQYASNSNMHATYTVIEQHAQSTHRLKSINQYRF